MTEEATEGLAEAKRTMERLAMMPHKLLKMNRRIGHCQTLRRVSPQRVAFIRERYARNRWEHFWPTRVSTYDNLTFLCDGRGAIWQRS
jgi:hypothetical protein